MKSSSNLRMLRNGKTVTTGKIAMIKKKSILKLKNNKQLVYSKTNQSNLSTLHDENQNNSHVLACDRLLGIRDFYIPLEKLSWPLINDVKVTLYDQTNNNTNKNWYKNLEGYIQLNELQFYNEQERTKETKSELIKTKTYLKTAISPVINKITNVRITRGMTTKLEIEKREQLNQTVVNKFSDITFNICLVKLDNISEKAKFLRTLGLTCRFKSINCF